MTRSGSRTGGVAFSAVVACSFIVALAAPLLAYRSHVSARRELATSMARLQSVTSKTGELARLRAALPSGASVGAADDASAGADDAALAQHMAAAIASSGLPASCLTALVPSADSVDASATAGAPSILRRRAALTLEGITLPELGHFLAAASERLPRWTVASIDLAPGPLGSSGGQPVAPGADLPVRARLTIESTSFVRPTPETEDRP